MNQKIITELKTRSVNEAKVELKTESVNESKAELINEAKIVNRKSKSFN